MLLMAAAGSTVALLNHVLRFLIEGACVNCQCPGGADVTARPIPAAITDGSTNLLDKCALLATRLAVLDEFIRGGLLTLVDDIPAVIAREAMSAWTLTGAESGASQILSEGPISGPERGVLLSAFFRELNIITQLTMRVAGMIPRPPPLSRPSVVNGRD